MKVEEGGNDSLSIEHKEEIHVIFHKSMDLLISNILHIINWIGPILRKLPSL